MAVANVGDELHPDVKASMTEDEILGLVSRAHDAGVRYLTVYAFSTE